MDLLIWMFPKIGVPQNGWFIMKNPIKMDDLGVPLFSETSIQTVFNSLLQVPQALLGMAWNGPTSFGLCRNCRTGFSWPSPKVTRIVWILKSVGFYYQRQSLNLLGMMMTCLVPCKNSLRALSYLVSESAKKKPEDPEARSWTFWNFGFPTQKTFLKVLCFNSEEIFIFWNKNHGWIHIHPWP